MTARNRASRPAPLAPARFTKTTHADPVYVQRRLNLRRIRWAGFDQDYTLIPWSIHRWEQEAFRIAKGELMRRAGELGLPVPLLRKWRYSPRAAAHGLVVDKEQGTILKLDQQHYPTIIGRGTKLLSRRELEEMAASVYGNRPIEVPELNGKSDERFFRVNSAYHMARLQLFARLTDLKLRNGLLSSVSFARLFEIADRAVDLANGDAQRLKTKIMEDPARYIDGGAHGELRRTEALLRTWREAGKALSLVTNSSWVFANAAMSALYGEGWRQLFDFVIVEARKPGFFTSDRLAERIVDDKGTTRALRANEHYEAGGVYRGGNLELLRRSLGLRQDQMLYVGDDVGSDGVSPKQAGLQTALIVPEIAGDQRLLEQHRDLLERRKELLDRERELRDSLGNSPRLTPEPGRAAGPAGGPWWQRGRDATTASRLKDVRRQRRSLDGVIDERFGRWGLSTRGSVPHSASAMAAQVAAHADLIASTVGDLAQLDPKGELEPRPFLHFEPYP